MQLFSSVLDPYEYADPDPGPNFSPFGSGSVGMEPKKQIHFFLKLYHKRCLKPIICNFTF